jgi:hypothetical protein
VSMRPSGSTQTSRSVFLFLLESPNLRCDACLDGITRAGTETETCFSREIVIVCVHGGGLAQFFGTFVIFDSVAG